MWKVLSGIILTLVFALGILYWQYDVAVVKLAAAEKDHSQCKLELSEANASTDIAVDNADTDTDAVGEAATAARDVMNDLKKKLARANALVDMANGATASCTAKLTNLQEEISNEEVKKLKFYYSNCDLPDAISRMLLFRNKGPTNDNLSEESISPTGDPQ